MKGKSIWLLYGLYCKVIKVIFEIFLCYKKGIKFINLENFCLIEFENKVWNDNKYKE